jgi:hypothetical protein
MEPRRFPPPWSVAEQDACFIVRDKARYDSVMRQARVFCGRLLA